MPLGRRIANGFGCCVAGPVREPAVPAMYAASPVRIRNKALTPALLTDVVCSESETTDTLLASPVVVNSEMVFSGMAAVSCGGGPMAVEHKLSARVATDQAWAVDSRSTTPSRGGWESSEATDEGSSSCGSSSSSAVPHDCSRKSIVEDCTAWPVLPPDLRDDLEALAFMPPPAAAVPPMVRRVIQVSGGVQSLHRAIVADPTTGILVDFMTGQGCQDIGIVHGRVADGISHQVFSYDIPLPSNVPEFLRRAMSLPAMLRGETVSRISVDGGLLQLSQRTRSQGIMYSDRIRIQNLHTFREVGPGEVEWCQWCEVVWLQPLPWTHAFLVKAIQQRALEEAKASADGFVAAAQMAGRGAH